MLRVYLIHILLIFSSFNVIYTVESTLPEISQTLGKINETTSGYINSKKQSIIYYDLTNITIHPSNANIRIRVKVNEFKDECPVLFSVREKKEILSWELPIIQKDENDKLIYYYSTERSLCSECGEKDALKNLQIDMSTCSNDLIHFSVTVDLSHDIVIRIDENPKTVVVSPVSPRYYRYDSEEQSVIVTVAGAEDDETCLIFSVQQPTCPIFDQETNIQYRGYWQTLTTRGSILLRHDKYPNGFFMVFVALTNGERCEKVSKIVESSHRSILPHGSKNNLKNKIFNLTIKSVIEPDDYVTPTLIPLVFIFGIILFIFVVFAVFQNVLERTKRTSDTPIVYKFTNKNSRFQSSLYLDELKETDVANLQRKSQRYFWSILTIGIFYCVPVIQLITNYLKVLYRTGDYDLCYYNYACARPLGSVMDFNHIYSNIGYVLFGLTFILFVNFRQRSLAQEEPSTANGCSESTDGTINTNQGIVRKILPRIFGNSCNEYGTFQNFGIYYALGIALILEGVLSSAYHLCPNQSNFQFDTSFMYVIAVLGIVKIYQFRHPLYLSANITFIGLAFVAASSVFGLLFESLIFKICFSVVYFFGLLSLLIYLYHIGFSTDSNGVLITSWIEVYKGVFRITQTHEKRISTSKFGRILLPFLAIIINVSLIIMLWTIMIDSNFATQLLAIFVTNFAVYTFYYAVMKFVHGEYRSKLWIQLVIYGCISVGLWILSLNYFRQAQSSWEDSPAESRELNNDCIVYSFYDSHDLWHFTSSGALLTSFMVLLTIDDDLISTRHENIHVF